jgi:hypothetical protein
MILVNDNNVIVLFNFGASHSFVAATFAQKHNLALSMLKNRMIVCPKVSILFKGGKILSQTHSS